MQNYHTCIITWHVTYNFTGCHFCNNGTFWNFQNKILTVFSMHVLLSAFSTRFCLEFSSMTEIRKCIDTLVYFKDNIATFSAVTAIWTTVRNIFFSAEADMTISAFSRFNYDSCTICKCHITTYFIIYIYKKRGRR